MIAYTQESGIDGRWSTTATKNKTRVIREDSDTGNRTPGYRVRDDNVSHYTISEHHASHFKLIYIFSPSEPMVPSTLSSNLGVVLPSMQARGK